MFETALPRPTIATIQRGVFNYTFKCIKTLKCERKVCDFYGTNTTWAVDGYIQPYVIAARTSRRRPG